MKTQTADTQAAYLYRLTQQGARTKTHDASHWERLEQVIRSTNLTVNSFAKHIGLPRGENLYQIKRGNNRISLGVAQRIHEHYPEYSVSWLLCGKDDSLHTGKDNPVVRIPVCRNIWTFDYTKPAATGEYLVVSASVANGAQFAVPYTDDILNSCLRNSMLLLRECRSEQIIYGNIYLLIMGRTRLVRIVREDADNPQCLRLVTSDPQRFGDLVVAKEKIGYMGLVCGAICQMER